MENSITVRDNRSAKEYVLPIENGSAGETMISGPGLAAVGESETGRKMRIFDPGFRNTASCKSQITFVDGENGVLRHRGFPIEDLVADRSFLEVAMLILDGRLPDAEEVGGWEQSLHKSRELDPDLIGLIRSFRPGSHTMGMLVGTLGSLSTFYNDTRSFADSASRADHITRMVGTVSSAAAFIYRHSKGLPEILPDPRRGFMEDVARTLFGFEDPHPLVVRALDVLFILHADHEQNCSANVMRSIGSAGADPYTALAGAAGALYGPIHGGANEAVLRMLEDVGSVENVAAYIDRVKRKEFRLMGVGHPVYRRYDPRAALIKQIAYDVFEVTGTNEQIDIALEIEKVVLEDDYFVSRSLNPNVDFYSGLIYQSLGLPMDMMTVMFAIPRTVGWLAQWKEMLEDREQTITRPRQIYTGEMEPRDRM
jgi:citrate synthase